MTTNFFQLAELTAFFEDLIASFPVYLFDPVPSEFKRMHRRDGIDLLVGSCFLILGNQDPNTLPRVRNLAKNAVDGLESLRQHIMHTVFH